MPRLAWILFVFFGACGGGTEPVVVAPVELPPTGSPDTGPVTPPPPAPPTPPPPGPGSPLAGGVVATFRVLGLSPEQTFRVWITDPQVIADLFDIEQGNNPNRFPSGRILTGAGANAHNAPYSWHLDPADTQMIEIAAEVCDGSPDYVEGNLAVYLNIQRYCPWSARLASIEDHR